jgi:phage-related protein
MFLNLICRLQYIQYLIEALDLMSKMTYSSTAKPDEKPVVWLKGEIVTPPFSAEARREAGALLGQLQLGISLGLPQSRPMPSIGVRCHELRITDKDCIWRIIHRVELDAIVILDVFKMKTEATPAPIIRQCKARLALYLKAIK